MRLTNTYESSFRISLNRTLAPTSHSTLRQTPTDYEDAWRHDAKEASSVSLNIVYVKYLLKNVLRYFIYLKLVSWRAKYRQSLELVASWSVGRFRR